MPSQIQFEPHHKQVSKEDLVNSNFAEGITAPVICPSRGNIDVFYREKCLKQVLLPFPAS